MSKDTNNEKRVSRINQSLSKRAKPPANQRDTGLDGTGTETAHGLDSVLSGMDIRAPKKPQMIRDEDVFRIVLIDEISEGNNPRSNMDPEELSNLIESVKLNGVEQPILCRFIADNTRPNIKYEVVAGHRRFKAARDAGLTSIPVLAKKMSDADALVAAVTENTNRDGMTPVDLILCYERLVDLDISRRQITAALGGKTKTSKIKKISESPYWREKVLEQGVSLRAAYEGAVRAPSGDDKDPGENINSPGDAQNVEKPSLNESLDSPPDDGPINTETAVSSPSPHGKTRSKKCLEAVFTDDGGKKHHGYVHLSEISFKGDTARYVALYSEEGGHRVVSLDQLQFLRGTLR